MCVKMINNLSHPLSLVLVSGGFLYTVCHTAAGTAGLGLNAKTSIPLFVHYHLCLRRQLYMGDPVVFPGPLTRWMYLANH